MSDKENIHIYDKLADMQKILRETNIPKSGKNKHNGAEYHTLDDLLPPVQIACEQHHILCFFDFPYDLEIMRDKAELHLINLDDHKQHLIFNVPFPALEKVNNGMNIMQSEGAYITYLKRYLLLDTFQLTESEVIDAMKPTDENTSGDTQQRGIVIEEVKPSVYHKVVDECKKRYPDDECNAKLLNKVSMQLLREGKITKEEKKEIYTYLKDK